MPIYSTEQWLPRPLDAIFPFFADARNLGLLTPPWLQFTVLTKGPIEMRAGTLIDYRIRFRGLPLWWRTRILEWNPPTRFRDDQVWGPFRKWVHTHSFETRNGGTLCRDEVDYSVWGGAIPDRLFVRPDVERIFAFRQAALAKRFPAGVSAESCL